MVGDSRTCVVIGGRGFIGRALILRLLKLKDWVVKIADSPHSLQLDPSERNSIIAEALSTGRAAYFHVDVRNKNEILKAIEGSSVVFLVDASASFPHDFYFCYTLIVQGAKNVINACRECKVKRLIYNSSANVVFDGLHDIHNGDESLPYAGKAQAEALVLLANDIDGLLTCALRPSNVFGPGDTEIIPFLVNQVKYGWGKFIIGSGKTMSDFTYVENVAHALICAEEALCSQRVSVSGKPFFISNLEPVKFWDFFSRILKGLGYQRPMIKLPARLEQPIVSLIKWMDAKMESKTLCTRTFNCSAAQKHIGYSTVVSMEDGVKSAVESFSHLSRDLSFARYHNIDEYSKVDKLLGSGKVADILLWRDEKKTFTCFLALVLLYYWFFFCGRTFISSLAKLLLLLILALSGFRVLRSNVLGFTIQESSLSSFEISEVDVTKLVRVITCMWNRIVAIFLYFLKFIFNYYLTEAIGVGLVLAFTAFFVYEQYEQEIDGISTILLNAIKGAMWLLIDNLPDSFTSFFHSRDCKITDI
ncbi:3-beta-hydroxysteroid-4-alpha-carboxylate 3-dehydrogenase (decarboxylating) [Bertholletia excelsa]